ncbi:N-acetylglucosamine-6-phosphate deacetylase [Fuerstiella marisgermanici]|uniref:N-acetylglucosamine-6-phosphate deacetylase n=1 Tax=Fuerstiella marisgermanici TaxID=1891926 RepID=A0A1P8WDF8_9PLAN|nr:amidohydrolase family protein [Fuerstiella marisgermanici]APZ92071.1 N-acetylglucosamine-6-phosphate deacetylase [Fuerstiella marisgermanici]
MTRILAKHYKTQAPIAIETDGERITSVEPLECSAEEIQQLPFVSPGLFDIQINGYNGIWFSSPELTVQNVTDVTEALLAKGIARYFPTLITASREALIHGFSTLRQACEENPLVNDCVAGYHLEGPYISAEDGPRGAHPLQHVRPADYEEFRELQAASGGRIKLVTLAAEAENAVAFIQQACQDGVVVALGHTGATPEQIQAAADAGAVLSTHFGNGAHGTLRRHPNYLWEQLADDRLWASVIADGWHVPASVLKCVLKCKTDQQTILTCDVSGFAGCPPGTYAEGDVGVEVLEDGRLVVAGQRQFLAGSGATTGDCVVHMADACEIPLATAVDMATHNPGRLFHEPIASIGAGDAANLTLFRVTLSESGGRVCSRFEPVQTFVAGKEYFSADAATSAV